MNAKQRKALTVEAGEASFELEVLASKQPVLVVFCTSWSRPCHILDSTLSEVATACAGTVKVVKVNADDNPDLSMWYEIQSIPTMLYFVDGSPRAKIVGTASKEAILSKLSTVVRGGNATSFTADATKETLTARNTHRQ